jgi:hypothetical protein
MALFGGSPEADRAISRFFYIAFCGCPLAVVLVAFLAVFLTVRFQHRNQKRGP